MLPWREKTASILKTRVVKQCKFLRTTMSLGRECCGYNQMLKVFLKKRK